MQPIILRPDQQQLKSDIYSSWNAGNRVVMAQAATGFGKSIVMSDVAKDLEAAKLRFPIIAHRNELVSQMSHHIAKRDIPHRIIGSTEMIRQITASHRAEFGMSYVHPTANASVCSVDTILARMDELESWGKQQDYCSGDEGHHFLRDNKWGKAVSLLTNARVLLVTATPGRPDGKGLGADTDGIVDDLVFGPSMRWLIENRALTEYEIVCPPSDLRMTDDDITDGGDYSPKKLKAASEKSRIVGDVVKEYARYALFKRAICFATDVETANKIAKNFNETGIRAASVSAKTPANVREKYIREFKEGKIYVLVNVDLFDEGFDVPACDVVIMARPTASIVKYLQQFGRAMRPDPLNPFKVALIIDHVSNVIRHGLPDKPRDWSLARRDKRAKTKPDPEDMPLTRCGNVSKPCCKLYPKFMSSCPHCGWEPPLPEPSARTIEMVEGDLVLLDREKLEQMRAAMQIESPGSVAQRVAKGAGFAGAGKHAADNQIEKIAAQSRLRATIEQWAGIERHKGRDDRETHRRFYHAAGMTVYEALAGDRTRDQFDKMEETVRGWYER